MHLPGDQQCCESVTLRSPLSLSRERNKTVLSLDLLLCCLSQELGIKHPLHRKKLQLALQALGSEEENNHGKLDYHWVTSKILDRGP